MSIFTGEWQCTKVENLDSVLKAKMPDITPDQISRYSSPEYWINYKFEIAADNLSMRMMTYNLNTEPILSEFDSTIVFNKNVSKIEGIYNVWSISARTLTAKWYSDSSSSSSNSNSSQRMNVTTIFTVTGDQMLEYGDFNGIIARRHFKRADHQIPRDDKNRGDENVVVQNQKKKNVFLNTVLMILCVSIIIKFFLFPKVDARIYLSILTPALFIAFFNLSYRKKVES